jgi:hypothetical protein
MLVYMVKVSEEEVVRGGGGEDKPNSQVQGRSINDVSVEARKLAVVLPATAA